MEIKIPSKDEIDKLWNKYETPIPVREHCNVVSQRALEIATLCSKLAADTKENYKRLECIRTAALLHDIARTQKDHEKVGAQMLSLEGYPELAWIVARHSDFPKQEWEQPLALETAILYLADKQVSGTEYVTVDARFAQSRKRIERRLDAEQALSYHQQRLQQTKEIILFFDLRER